MNSEPTYKKEDAIVKINRKWAMIAGTAILSVGLLAGGVYAASAAPGAANTAGQPGIQDRLDQQVKDGKLTQGEADLLKQLAALRQSYMQKFKTDAKSMVDQAVKDGKITQDQANNLQQRWQRDGKMHGRMGKDHKWGGKNMSLDQLKAKLDQAVKDGKLTQQQADKMLQRWTAHQQKQGQEQQQKQP